MICNTEFIIFNENSSVSILLGDSSWRSSSISRRLPAHVPTRYIYLCPSLFPSISLDFPRFCSISLDFPRFCSISLDFARFPSISLIFPRFCSILLDFARFPSILLDFPRFCSILLDFARFLSISLDFARVLLTCARFCSKSFLH